MNVDIINLFGTRLAVLIQKPVLACKGLVRFAIQDYFKAKKVDGLTLGFDQFLIILDLYIKPRLLKSGIKDVEYIIKSLRRSIIDNQAIFTIHQ